MPLLHDHAELLHRVRRAEFERIFCHCAPGTFDWVLELGAGDGYQSHLLRSYARHLIVSDMNYQRLRSGRVPASRCVIADAENIGSLFPAGHFDMIFSSSLLEHLPDPLAALSGMHAILRDDGICVHVMPNRFWKICQLALYNPSTHLAQAGRRRPDCPSAGLRARHGSGGQQPKGWATLVAFAVATAATWGVR